MAAPTLFAAGALFAAQSGTNITAVIPASTTTNDIMILVVACNGASTFTTPTDWTQFGPVVNNANMSFNQFWKRHDGSESNPSSTTSATGSTIIGLYGRIYSFRSCFTGGTPFENSIGAGPTNSTTPTVGGVNVSGLERLVVGITLVDDDNTYNSGNPPTNWSVCGNLLTTSTGGDCMSSAISRVRDTGTYGSVIMGTMNASDYWCTIGFALIPQVVDRTASLTGTGTLEATGKVIHHSRTGSVSGTGTLTATGSVSDPPTEPILVDTEVNPSGDVTLTGSLFAGDLAIVTIAAWNGNSLAISSAISGNSLTWTTRSINSSNANKHTYVAIAYAEVTSDISASILVDMTNAPGAGTTGDYAASLYRLPGGSAVQFKTGSGDTHSGNPTTFGITLDSAPSADNGTLMVFGITEAFDGQCTIDLKPGWTELEGNEDGTLNDLSYIVGWRENSTSTAVQVEFSKDEYREAMVAVEFALSAPSIVQRTGSLTGTGTLTATGLKVDRRTASISGTGTLTGTGLKITKVTASLSGTGTLTATGVVIVKRTASLSGTNVLTATGAVVIRRTATFNTTGTLTANSVTIIKRTAIWLGIGTLTANGLKITKVTASLTGVAVLAADSNVIGYVLRTGSLTGVGTLTGVGRKLTSGSVQGVGTLTAVGNIVPTVVQRTGSISGVGTLTAFGNIPGPPGIELEVGLYMGKMDAYTHFKNTKYNSSTLIGKKP